MKKKNLKNLFAKFLNTIIKKNGLQYFIKKKINLNIIIYSSLSQSPYAIQINISNCTKKKNHCQNPIVFI